MKTTQQLIKELNFYDLIAKLKTLFQKVTSETENVVNLTDDQDNIDGAKEFLQPVTAPEGTEPNHLVTLSQLGGGGEGDYIPLSGTIEDSPVTGDIEFSSSQPFFGLKNISSNINFIGFSDDGIPQLRKEYTDSSEFVYIGVAGNNIEINSNISDCRGIMSAVFFNKQNDPNAFAQLGDVGVAGSFSGIGTATTVFTVAIGLTQPNNTYKANVTPTSALSAALFYVTNKTTTTFDVVYLAGLTGTVTFDWSIKP